MAGYFLGKICFGRGNMFTKNLQRLALAITVIISLLLLGVHHQALSVRANAPATAYRAGQLILKPTGHDSPEVISR